VPTTSPPAPLVGLATDPGGQRVPTAWERARRAVPSTDRWEGRLTGWAASIVVTLLALSLRLWDLGSPKEFEFDETYYAKDAWSMLNHGYVRGYTTDANDKILAGHPSGSWTDGPSMIVHPEVGKWLIALGEKAFGMDPFGWRFSAAVVGSLMVLVMIRLARRVTGSMLLGLVAGLLMTFDGLQLVLSRLALLDIFLAFFMLCGVTCMVVDRDWYRARLARLTGGRPVTSGWGPVRGTLWRPWLLLAGLSWGLALGTKWTAIYPLAAFGILVWLWSSGARRAFGVRRAVLRSILTDALPAFVHVVVLAGIVYVASWSGWLAHASEYEDSLSSTQYTQFTGQGHCDGENFVSADPDSTARWPTATEADATGPAELVQSLRSLYYYHQDMFTFHTNFLNCSTHVYASTPMGWPLLNRPVGVAADTGIQPGTRGCDAPQGSDCLRQVLLIGTPVLWWGGVGALLLALVMWVGARDWRYGLAVVGFASAWLPWLQYDDRPIFSFYAIAMLPFLVLAVVLAMGMLIGRSREPSARRTWGVIVAGAFFVLVLVNFAWFWPVLTNGLLTHKEWVQRIWFSRWV
jgi:dolichyl-phosphate-mannose-protein mannosyltransferase